MYDPAADRYYETEEINTLLFRDSGLKDGSELQLKPPVKKAKATPTSVESEEANGDEDMPVAEGDDNASEVGSEDTEEAMRKAQEAYEAQAAEEGEGEEGECDMQEDDEDAAEAEGEIYQAGSEADKASIADAPAEGSANDGDAPEEAD